MSLSQAVLILIRKFLTAFMYFYLNSGNVVLSECLTNRSHRPISNLVTAKLAFTSAATISMQARAILKSSLKAKHIKTS